MEQIQEHWPADGGTTVRSAEDRISVQNPPAIRRMDAADGGTIGGNFADRMSELFHGLCGGRRGLQGFLVIGFCSSSSRSLRPFAVLRVEVALKVLKLVGASNSKYHQQFGK